MKMIMKNYFKYYKEKNPKNLNGIVDEFERLNVESQNLFANLNKNKCIDTNELDEELIKVQNMLNKRFKLMSGLDNYAEAVFGISLLNTSICYGLLLCSVPLIFMGKLILVPTILFLGILYSVGKLTIELKNYKKKKDSVKVELKNIELYLESCNFVIKKRYSELTNSKKCEEKNINKKFLAESFIIEYLNKGIKLEIDFEVENIVRLMLQEKLNTVETNIDVLLEKYALNQSNMGLQDVAVRKRKK